MAVEPTPAARAPRTFEAIAQQIRERIVAGELKAGDKLPPERELAEQLKVGRNAIREAFRTLEIAGVVRLEKGRSGGAYIRPANASRMTLAMQDLMDYGSIELDELTESRIAVMEMITRMACDRGTEQDFDAIEHNIDQTDAVTAAGQMDRRAELAAEFYTLVARATHNRVLVLLVTSMSQILPRLMQAQIHVAPRPPGGALVASRRRYLRMLRARDPQGAFAELRAQMLEGHRIVAALIAGKTPKAASVSATKAAPGRRRA